MKHLSAQQVEALSQRMAERTRAPAARIRDELAACGQQHYRDLAGTVIDTAVAVRGRRLPPGDAFEISDAK